MARWGACAAARPVAWPLAALLLAGVLAGRAACLSLKLDRSTAHTLLIDIVCGSSCDGNFTWEYKASQEAAWGSPPRTRQHYLNPSAFYLRALPMNSVQYVRVRQDPGGVYSNELRAWTCPERPANVTALRVASAGAGWLDIRWKPPAEQCLGRYYYNVRYKPGDAPFTPFKKYGFYDKDDLRAAVNPSHPCDPTTKEFCVLLTDKVRPGMTHVVELQAKRIGGEDGESTQTQSLTAYADPDNTGPQDVAECPLRKTLPEGAVASEEEHNPNDSRSRKAPIDGVLLPLWLAALLGTAFFLVLATLAGLWLRYGIRNPVGTKEQKFENLRRPSAEHTTEERYVRPRDVTSIRTSNLYEEHDNEVPIYEEVGIQFGNQSSSNTPVVQYKSEKCT